jgi:hypothetical protein
MLTACVSDPERGECSQTSTSGSPDVHIDPISNCEGCWFFIPCLTDLFLIGKERLFVSMKTVDAAGLSSGIYFPRTYSSRAPHLNASIDSKPQYYQRHTLKMDPKEFAIQSAIADYNSGVFTSLRKAAKWYGIAESTLRGRRRGQQPHAIAHQQQQRLTPEQEAFLVD